MTQIVFIGDTHGEFMWIPRLLERIPQDVPVIQVGDFGFWPDGRPLWSRQWAEAKRAQPIYAIDGNHEYFPLFEGITEPTEIWDGVIYVPRGTVLEFEGVKVGFMGGGASIDKKYRKEGVSWFPEEAITQAEYEKLNKVDHVDILCTHVPPQKIIEKHFQHPSLKFPYFGLAPDWIDPTAVLVNKLWEKFGKPPLICGHMHRSLHDTAENVHMLDINEIYVWRSKDEYL